MVSYKEGEEKKMTVEIYIDEDKETIIVGKPQFEYEITHTEFDTQFDKKKIWVKRITKVTIDEDPNEDPREHLPWTDPLRHP